jgi:uncharacterized membrane protein HdeD (DUF308 family)
MLATLAAQNWGLFILRGVLAILFGIFALVLPGATLAALIFVFAVYAIVDGIVALGAGLGAPGGIRWWIVVGGILALAIGLYTLVNPGVTAIALVYLIGSFAVVRGAAEIATAVQMRKMIENEWLFVLNGAVAILFGLFVLVAPGAGALAVLWLIGYFAIFAGVMFIVLGLRLRSHAKAGAMRADNRAAS